MHILKGIIIAFSIYSKIPVPQLRWEEEDMRYMLCFFPWVGVIIGLGIYLWNCLCVWFKAGNLCRSLGMAAIPLIITGGFHVDGFMDTMDAFHSYQTREKKLEILKDPHIGAFAVIMLGIYGMIHLAAVSEIENKSYLGVLCCGFFLARCLSGIGVVCFPSARKEGMLQMFADGSQRQRVNWCLKAQGTLCTCVMGLMDIWAALVAFVIALGTFWRYRQRCIKELGGITGDTAGWFVVRCEVWMAVAMAVMDIVQRGI